MEVMVTSGPNWRSLLGEHLELALTLRRLKIFFDPALCQGVWECYEVCPVDCWLPDRERGIVILQNEENCIACGACVLQCPENAIQLGVPHD
jgi:NAD-dependent dihydropyrimidine dehydrogenase PreA subunit